MSIKVSKMADISLIIMETHPPLQIPDDALANMVQAAAFKKELNSPIYRLIDITRIDLNFSDMMIAMAAERDQEGGSSDPDVTTLFVGSGELVEMGTKALADQEQYGKAMVLLFTSQEEAIAYARENPLS